LFIVILKGVFGVIFINVFVGIVVFEIAPIAAVITFLQWVENPLQKCNLSGKREQLLCRLLPFRFALL